MTHCRRCGTEMADPWPAAPLCPRCEGRTGAMACEQCGEPLIKAPELNKPFNANTIDREGALHAYRCPNGHVKYESFD